jgi:hypothetical protein
MEVIDIGFSDMEPISLNLNNNSSMNFGGGIEMFMNDEQRSSAKQVSVDFEDLDKLESQLNQLKPQSSSSSSLFGDTTKSISGMASNLFGYGSGSSVKEEPAYEKTDSKLGQSTTSGLGNAKTWDGFTKVGDIPSGPSKQSSTNNMSYREIRRKKRIYLSRLNEWYESGHLKQSPSHFTMESDFTEIEDEYESALEDKKKKDSIKLQGWWFMTLVNSVEYANAAFDPFGINLDGWGEKVSEELTEYEDIFGELHDKYKGGKLSPEVSLIMRLGFSAAVVGFSNKALSAAAPGFSDIIRQSPELMRTFNDATVKSLSQQSPAFAFAKDLMNPSPNDVNTSFGPPPKAVETKSQPPPTRPGQMSFTQTPSRESNRPDISMGRGAMFRENGVEVGNGYSNIRPEMRGPQTNVEDILAGLKTKPVRVEDESMISITSLKEMASMEIPKKNGRRKPRSDKNTISLGDI